MASNDRDLYKEAADAKKDVYLVERELLGHVVKKFKEAGNIVAMRDALGIDGMQLLSKLEKAKKKADKAFSEWTRDHYRSPLPEPLSGGKS